jgi:hypothetical protein
MTLTHTETQHALKMALDRLETSLVEPVMAGELIDWVRDVQDAWNEAAEHVREHVVEIHPRQFQEMASEDAELLPRTEKLRSDDEAIGEDLEEFARTLHRFAEHAPKFEPDEEKIAKHTRDLVDEGIELITRVRKQEAAVQAWFLEAFTRDRGVAD